MPDKKLYPRDSSAFLYVSITTRFRISNIKQKYFTFNWVGFVQLYSLTHAPRTLAPFERGLTYIIYYKTESTTDGLWSRRLFLRWALSVFTTFTVNSDTAVPRARPDTDSAGPRRGSRAQLRRCITDEGQTATQYGCLYFFQMPARYL